MDVQSVSRNFPALWKTFEKVVNGKIRKFWVQDLPEEYFKEAIDLLFGPFLRDEPVCKALKVLEDEGSFESAKSLWATCLEEKCSLACFTKTDNGKTELVGVNCCTKKTVENEIMMEEMKKKLRGEKFMLVFSFFEYVSKMRNPYEELKIESYLSGAGLIIKPEYRGHNIGLEILMCRDPLCKALGLKASLTLFTSPASQKLAERAGFKDFVNIRYEDVEKKEPSLRVSQVGEYSERVRLMYIMYN